MVSQNLNHEIAAVLSLAGHFRELKSRALGLLSEFEASERGFFTPTEDEQTRQLLVSYWHSRNALADLVLNVYRESIQDGARKQELLTVAYAGALVLVDGARFLRENCHHLPIVRRKLNEPEPHFDIPQGTYDLVQKSLTRPTHAWHLYHAMTYVTKHWKELRQKGQVDHAFDGVLDLIKELQQRLDVTPESFVLARTRVRARSLRTRLGRNLLGKALYGLQKCVSGFMADKYVKLGHQPQLPTDIDHEVTNQLQPGDVIVVRKEHAFTNYFLPGYWPHAALYIGSSDELQEMQLQDHENVRKHWEQIETADASRSQRVLEAMKDGVRIRSLNNPYRSDAIAVIRPLLSKAEKSEAIGRGFFHAGKSYDFDFDFTRSDRLVCTEVVYRSFEGVGNMNFKLTPRAGRLTLSAEDLLQKAVDSDGFDVSLVYCPALASAVQHEQDGKHMLQQTIGKKSV